MAVSEDQSYDVFIVHSSEDNEAADMINTQLQKKGLKTFAHYKEGVEFTPGRPVFDNIIHAVKASRIILILLTKNALQSQWVTFEVLMGLEKSQREDSMCVRLVFEGVSEQERKEVKRGSYHWIPDVVVDFNKDAWVDDLVATLNEEVRMRELLPAGNVAHGLVFNYYIGFLAYVVPALAKTVAECEYSKQGKVSSKFFIIIPETSEITPLEHKTDEFIIEKMQKPLDMDVTHGDKKRKYNPSVYKITKQGSDESYFFSADMPFIMATMSKMKNMGFADLDVNQQIVRFRMTLMELVEHRNNDACRDKAEFISYNGVDESPAKAIWDCLVKEFTSKPTAQSKQSVATKTASLKSEGKDISATINHMVDIEKDHTTAAEIQNFLGQKHVQFNGDSGSNFQALENARWNIFILSEEAVKDPEMCAKFKAALEYSIHDNEIQVIPVLASGSDIRNIPFDYKWITLLKEDEPNYKDKLWKCMQDNRTMSELLPSGMVYQGLAYAYLINYLPFNLTEKTAEGRDFKERFIDAMSKYKVDCSCVPKMFVIVPKSCSFPPPGSNFANEEHLGALEPVVLGFRKYFLQLYRLTMSNGKQVCYAREYATPAVALHDMAQLPFAGLNKQEMNEQARKFAEFSEEIMKNPVFTEKIGDLGKKCEMVYFDDETMGAEGVTKVLEERLMKCIEDGNVI